MVRDLETCFWGSYRFCLFKYLRPCMNFSPLFIPIGSISMDYPDSGFQDAQFAKQFRQLVNLISNWAYRLFLFHNLDVVFQFYDALCSLDQIFENTNCRIVIAQNPSHLWLFFLCKCNYCFSFKHLWIFCSIPTNYAWIWAWNKLSVNGDEDIELLCV